MKLLDGVLESFGFDAAAEEGTRTAQAGRGSDGHGLPDGGPFVGRAIGGHGPGVEASNGRADKDIGLEVGGEDLPDASLVGSEHAATA